jgi:MFS family permease
VRNLILAVLPVLVAVFLMIAGNGLLNTLIPYRATVEGFGPTVVGLIGSSYFIGMLIGTWTAPGVVRRVGHIRTFAAYSAITAVTVLILPITVTPIAWMLCRALIGFGFAGLYAVVEGWVSAKAGTRHRGRMMGIYNLANFSGSAIGQQALRAFEAKSYALFSAAAAFLMLALVPMAMTKAEPPPIPARGRLLFGELLRRSPTSLVTAILLGLANGAFWSLIPAYVERLHLGAGTVASFMTATIIGSAISPYPVGRLADKFDRRAMIAALSGATMTIEILLYLAQKPPIGLFYALGFLAGALITVIYPVMTALSVDRLGVEKAVPVSSTSLFLYCIGAIIGPSFVAWLMTLYSDRSLFVFNAAIHALLVAFVVWRIYTEGPEGKMPKMTIEPPEAPIR